MKKFIVAASIGLLSLLGVQNNADAQVRVRGTFAAPGVRVHVGNGGTYYHHWDRGYYRPYYGYGYRPVPTPYYGPERVWMPGHWSYDGYWVPGHYSWVR